MNQKDIFWTEKYRPRKISDIILPKNLKETFAAMIKQGAIGPSLLFHGTAGTGKTTVAYALAKELGYDVLYINGSDEGRLIETMRTKIKQFATSVSFSSARKVVLFDEMDNAGPDAMLALRGISEAVADNCSFIMTCNFLNKVIEPIRSRSSNIDFTIQSEEKSSMAMQFFKRACSILDENNVTYDKQAVASLISNHMPDWRRILNELQQYSAKGHIDAKILTTIGSLEVTDLAGYLRDKDFKQMRAWVGENPSMSIAHISRQIYDNLSSICKPDSMPAVVLILAEYCYKEHFCADREINTAACLTQLMAECEWK